MPPVIYTTNRYLFDYEGNSGAHTTALHAVTGEDVDAQLADAATFQGLLAALLTTDATVTGVRFQAAGTNFTEPLGFGPSAGSGGGAVSAADYPNFISFVGRGQGVRTRISIFNTAQLETADYRNTGAERTAAQLAVINYLNSTSTSLRATKAGVPAVWKPYVNVGVNAYYQRRRRATA